MCTSSGILLKKIEFLIVSTNIYSSCISNAEINSGFVLCYNDKGILSYKYLIGSTRGGGRGMCGCLMRKIYSMIGDIRPRDALFLLY